VDADSAPASPAEAERVANQRSWAQGRRLLVFRAVPLVYLFFVAHGVTEYSRGAAAVCGYALLAAFGLCWLVPAPALLWQTSSSRRFWALCGIFVALFAAELPFARASAFVMCLFITILTVARWGGRSAPAVLALALGALLVPVAIPSWHDSLRATLGGFIPVAIPVAAVVTFIVLQLMRGNHALADARAELARLAAENERFRIARDLHDLLGHSLTTITVKLGLARRLGAPDPAQALQEIAEVETLARQSLADVRAAVTGYRDVTLAGELATGRELLQAVGITADLPGAVDIVDPAYQKLFGWAVREGLTNVIRHAHASSCAVRLSRSSVEIVDDGVGVPAAPGNGLSGLRERVAAAGGVLDAGPLQPSGWRLRVSLSPDGGTQ
jgi:two-component system, NarL family, sensor histidine kinase DesK